MADNYVNAAISNVRVLERVSKDSRVSLAESLSDNINDIVYDVEDVTNWLGRKGSCTFSARIRKTSGFWIEILR